MATSKAQRISIIVIAVVLVGGTLGLYFVTIFSNGNQAATQQNQQQTKDQAIKDHLAAVKPLDGYTAAAFDAASVTALQQEDLVPGTGAEVAATSTVTANYFGWMPDGTIFDSTNKNGTTTAVDFQLSQVIKGWSTGLVGMKEGGVRKLVIPADQAYGPTGDSNGIIPANTPLTFIVELTKVK
ncbi:MAG TPA: FKBP-type peptidyl-prolyl cis-trans isomerase [Candidatus Saccharimonadales bacterium]|jgi:FKBP-type peptidyl-prolyl cis-trans isomerase|nr:FKBP-type peptidyl-prolyl cis-trans isomerase [Candidatus Saccharimonadales bacterium]